MKLPLAGLRILAVEQYGAGPYGSTHLADMGAEVIKIEHRASGGDMSRGVGPYFLGEHDSHFFQSLNRNKKIAHARPEASAAAARCSRSSSATAEGLFGNMRGDQPEKLRLRYDDLKHLNPRDRVRAPLRLWPRGRRARAGRATTTWSRPSAAFSR